MDGQRHGERMAGDERVALVSGMNDVMLCAAVLAVELAAGSLLAGAGAPGHVQGAVGVGIAIALCEGLLRRRHARLTGLVLCWTATAALALAVWSLPAWGPDPLAETGRDLPAGMAGITMLERWNERAATSLAAGSAGALAMGLRYGIGAGAALAYLGAWLAALAAFGAATEDTIRWLEAHLREIILASGIGAMAIGAWLDRRDAGRGGALDRAAFWLHLLGAWCVVHPLFHYVDGTAAGTVALYLGLAAVALWLNRRSVLVAGMIYFVAALSGTLAWIAPRHEGWEGPALVVGALLIALGVGWRPIRAGAARLVLHAVARRRRTG